MRGLLRGGALGRLVAPGSRAGLAAAIADAPSLVQDPRASLVQARRYAVEFAAPAYLALFARISNGSKKPPIDCGMADPAPSRLQPTATRALHARVD
jgi:hypothetical protein